MEHSILLSFLIQIFICSCNIVNKKSINLINRSSNSENPKNDKSVYLSKNIMLELVRVAELHSSGYNVTFISDQYSLSYNFNKIFR